MKYRKLLISASLNVFVFHSIDDKIHAIYGRLYDWATAMAMTHIGYCNEWYCTTEGKSYRGICPDGWHLPDSTEWQELVDFAGGNDVAEKKLKAKSGWFNYFEGVMISGNGTDDYGFAALPGGSCSEYVCYLIGSHNDLWSTTDYAIYARYFSLSRTSSGLNSMIASKPDLKSVRCLKD